MENKRPIQKTSALCKHGAREINKLVLKSTLNFTMNIREWLNDNRYSFNLILLLLLDIISHYSILNCQNLLDIRQHVNKKASGELCDMSQA